MLDLKSKMIHMYNVEEEEVNVFVKNGEIQIQLNLRL